MPDNGPSSSAPAVRGFQMGGGEGADVNLFRGDLTMPLPLVHLPGLGGHGADLRAMYSSDVNLEPDTQNLDAPTGVLGLGWSLGFDTISFAAGFGTASFLEGSFTANIEGGAFALILVEWANRGATNEYLVFASEAKHPLWTYTYYPNDEKWIVLRDDGVTLVFGDPDLTDANAVQWGVRWDNWAGNSSCTGSKSSPLAPQRYARAWNITQSKDQWGNAITYRYTAEVAPVTSALNCTRASHLAKITDAFGRTVLFTYGDKQAIEYQAPHTVSGEAPTGAFQDRYATKYLERLDVVAPNGSDSYTSVFFGYEVMDLGDTQAGAKGTSNKAKRYLTSITRKRYLGNIADVASKPDNFRQTQPSTTFAYDLEAASPGRGRLLSTTSPMGRKTSWTYTRQTLGDTAVFNLKTVVRPSSDNYRFAGLWFGGDYAVIAWYYASNQSLEIQVMQYGGRWAAETPSCTTFDGVKPRAVNDLLDLKVAFGSDFFALYWENETNQTGDLVIFQKKPNQFGQWTPSHYPEFIADMNGDDSEAALVVGTDFVAVHATGSQYLYYFLYDRRTKTWSPDPNDKNPPYLHGSSDETKMALQSSGNILAVGYFEDTGSNQVYGRYQVYWLDSGGTGTPQFHVGYSEPQSVGPFGWDSAYVTDFLSIGSGFAVASYAQDGQTQLRVMSWARNYNPKNGDAFRTITKQGDATYKNKDGVQVPSATVVSGSTIANGGYVYRFDGLEWVDFPNQSWAGRMLAGTEDFILAQDMNNADESVPLVQFNPTSSAPETTAHEEEGIVARLLDEIKDIGHELEDAVAGRFDSTEESGPSYGWRLGNISNASQPQIPSLSDRFMTIGSNLYYADTDFPCIIERTPSGPWQAVSGAFEDANQASVVCKGPTYVAYTFQGTDATPWTRVALLFNGAVYPVGENNATTLPDETFINAATGEAMCADNAFATYDSSSAIDNVQAFSLYRILNRQFQGAMTDTVITEKRVDTGTQTLITKYSYDTDTAVFDSSGTVAQYQQATATRVDADNNSLGKTVYQYLNGLPPEAKQPEEPIAACYSLGAGYVASQTEYDDAGTKVSSATNTWEGVTLATKHDGGFTPLAGVTLLRLATHVDTLSNLDVIDLSTNTSTGTKASRTLQTTHTYVAETGHMRAKQLSLYDAAGAQQVRTATRTYAWEVYPEMKAPSGELAPRLDAEAIDTMQIGAKPANPVNAQATTYVADKSSGAWAQTGTWQWTGGGTINDGVPAFDFTNPDQQSNWTCRIPVKAFNDKGLPTLVRNALGGPECILYDTSGRWHVASVANSDGSDCGYTGFEAYEREEANSCAPWSGGSITTADAHTGSACAQVAAGQALTYAALTAAANQDRYVLGVFVKSAAGTKAEISLSVGAAAATKTVTADGTWQYVFVYAQSKGAGSTIDCAIKNTGASALLVDDIWVRPLVSRASTTVYDPRMLPEARIGQNGSTTQTFYDFMLKPLSYAGPDAQMRGHRGSGYARGGYDAVSGRWNQGLALSAYDGGPFDDFRDGDGWKQRWTTKGSGTWSVSNRVLTHSGTGQGSVALNNSGDYSNLAVLVEVHEGAAVASASGSFGITIGTSLTAQWSATNTQWELLDRSNTVIASAKDTTGGAPELPSTLLLIASAHGAMLFVNQQLTLSHAFASSDPTIAGALALVTDADQVGFAKVQVFLTPLARFGLSDGAGRPLQTQAVADNEIIVAQHFYDALGRGAITTKPAIYGETAPNGAATVFGYQSGFATAPDLTSDTPTMSGYVNTYYSGDNGRSDDGGYPYSRKRLENSKLSRVLEVGQPGAVHAIRSGNAHTSTLTYGTNAAKPFFSAQDVPADEYDLVIATDADGLVSTRIRDQLGNNVASVSSGPKGSEVQRLSVLFNDRDLPRATLPPNGYAGKGDGSAWQQEMTVDYFGRLTAYTTPDTNTTRMVYDSAGNLRFRLTADGAASGAQNPCTDQVMITYVKYDALNRPVENGYVCQASWDESQLAKDADEPDWPTTGVWRHRYTYDGDGTTAYAQGNLTTVETSATDGTTVTQTFTYNLLGKKLSVETSVSAGKMAAHAAFSGTVRYAYDEAGRLSATTTPSLTGGPDLTVRRHYNARGLLASLAVNDGNTESTIAQYTWNAAGKAASESLGGGTVSRTFAHTSRGALRSIEGNLTKQSLYYDTAPDPQPKGWTPRYDGLLSAMTYKFGTEDPATWTMAWDDHKRLTSVAVTDGDTLTYQYDANGNVTKYNDVTLTLKSGTNQLESGTYTSSGKLSANADWSFGYDPVTDLPISVQSADQSETLSVTFGRAAQRVSKAWTTKAGTDARLYLPGAHSHAMTEATQSNGGPPSNEVRYIRGPMGLIAVQAVNGSKTSLAYVVRDHQGSSRLVVDGNGKAMASFDYRPFGQTTPGDAAAAMPYPYRYTGQEQDDETGFYNYRHRLYDPSTLRFLTPDPAHQSFSPYVYVGDDPLLRTDATGEKWNFFGGLVGGLEVVGGALTTGLGVMTGIAPLDVAGGAMIGAGVAGIAYSAESGHKFGWHGWGQAEAGGAIGGAELAAGIYVMATTGNALAANTLISMGVNGIAYSSMNAGQDANAFWTGFGISQAAGLAAGVVGYGVGEGLGIAADAVGLTGEGASLVSSRLTNMAIGAVGAGAAGAASETTSTGFEAWANHESASQAYKQAFGSGAFWASEGLAVFMGGVGGYLEDMTNNPAEKWANQNPARDFDDCSDQSQQIIQLDNDFSDESAAERPARRFAMTDVNESAGAGWRTLLRLQPSVELGYEFFVFVDPVFEAFFDEGLGKAKKLQ